MGKNILIICQEEMVRAMQIYLNHLILEDSQRKPCRVSMVLVHRRPAAYGRHAFEITISEAGKEDDLL